MAQVLPRKYDDEYMVNQYIYNGKLSALSLCGNFRLGFGQEFDDVILHGEPTEGQFIAYYTKLVP